MSEDYSICVDRCTIFFKFLFIFKFFGCARPSLHLHGLSLVIVSTGCSLLPCIGFSLRGLPLLWSMSSRHVGVGNCGTQAQ